MVTARPFVLAVLVVAFAYVAGPRPVLLFSELACPTGHIQRPVGLLAGTYVCEAPGDAVRANPTIGRTAQREFGLSLTNLHVRLFDSDLETDSYLGFAVGVP